METELSVLNDPERSSSSDYNEKSHRQTWSSRLDFFISLLGTAVGLGNIWRFPYLCYRNGGGVFLIPYAICVILMGFPLLLLDISIGQLFSRGGIGIWNWCPVFRGIGYFNLVYLWIGSCTYGTVIGWSIYYTASSFFNPLPWSTCNNSWNTLNCTLSFNESTGVSSSAEFWEYSVLRLSNGIDEVGVFQWKLYLCVISLWIFIFLCLSQGINITGKIMYVIVILPYILLLMLLGYGAHMPGSYHGIQYLLSPDWERLKDLQVWADAGMQVYFSLVGGGNVAIALGSYNSYDRRSVSECAGTAVINSLTSLMAGFVIFMALGSMSFQTGIPVDQVAGSGPGLAFVTYPLLLSRLPLPQLWSVVFFMMMVGLGLSSLLMGGEAMTCMVSDDIPSITVKRSYQRRSFLAFLCISSCIISIPLVYGNGMYVLQMCEFFNGSRFMFFAGLLNALILMYFCDRKRFISAISRMYRLRIEFPLFVVWGILAPPFLAFLSYCSVRAYTRLSLRRGTTGEMYMFPKLSIITGWTLATTQITLVPGYMTYLLIKIPGSIRDRWKIATRPSLDAVQCQRLKYPSIESFNE